MALNLSTLTSPATSGDVLAEALTTADFLEPVPVLRNLARGSQKGGDAKQDVALNQPKALPLIDGDGYLYLSGITGNSATIPHDSSLDLTHQLEVVARIKYRSYSGADAQSIVTKWASGDFNFRFATSGYLQIYFKDSTNTTRNSTSAYAVYNNNISDGDTIWVKMTIDAASTSTEVDFYTSKDNVKNEEDVTWTSLGTTRYITTNSGISSGPNPVSFGAFDNSGAINDDLATGAVLKANYKATIGGSPVLDVDFTAPNVRHGDTAFECATGQVVTINQSGQNPASIIKKSVLRFDGVDDGLDGLFASSVDSGYMFAAFSVLGDGGENYARVFATNESGQTDVVASSWIWSLRNATSTGIGYYNNGSFYNTHTNMYDDARGDYLHEHKVISGSQKSAINNADLKTTGNTTSLVLDEFHIGVSEIIGDNNAAIDLEYLALFPATITDSQADAVRNYINNRNNVFDLKDGFGYYFYDAQKAPVGNISSGSASWNGRIVGSDNGDTDKFATQATANDQPVSDGYVVTFADNTDHLDIPSTTQAGWQVVGTSLGTFAYRVNANAVTELNLLGNLGSASHRKAGDLYGIILLPESATGRDIEQARKLLIDRGAADAPTGIISNYFRNRQDIVSFGLINTSTVSDLGSAWYYCTNITSFPLIDTSTVTGFSYAWGNNQSLTSFPLLNTSAGSSFINTWYNCVSLNNFPALNMSNGTSFSGAWLNCSALTSFPAGAKLGTEANNVNFTSAWESSGLTSFSTPLPTATTVSNAWRNCTSLTSFSSELPLVTTASNAWRDCSSLTSFSTDLPLATSVSNAWRGCSSLESFSSALPSVTDLSNAWRGCSSLESFSSALPSVTDASNAWQGCSPLESFSAELPLVTTAYAAWYRCASLESFSTELPLATSTRFAWYQCTSLTDFSADVFANWNPSSISSGVFNIAWDGCTSLTSQSVENILTSIDSSGKYATSTGASGGSALADAGIDITYDGSGLTAATTAAIDSLSGKGWQVYINGELVIPNILDLEPAAAYSLRSFDADADPNVVNVRRSSDGATSDFTASEVSDGTLVAWVGAGNDGHVTTWYDQSSNGLDSSQSTASAQPKIVDAGTLVTDSANNPAIIGDGVDDTLFHPTLTNELDSSDFLVTAAYKDELAMGIIGAIPRLYLSNSSMAYNTLGTISYTKQTGRNVMSFQVTGNTQEVFGNGASLGTASETQVDIGQNMFNVMQGGSTFSDGPLMEVVVFGDNQVANRTGIEANINDTYTIY